MEILRAATLVVATITTGLMAGVSLDELDDLLVPVGE
jgi:hypothetical protein